MFFHPDVLQRHTGCFATIWLAATKGRKLTKREMQKVLVDQTCEELIRYITGQVPAPQPGQPRPRFSLYLASQLQYGVILVYHRQCGFMLEEAQQIVNKLLRKSTPRNDFAGPDRLVLDMADDMFLMEQAEGAQDPFFGLMNVPSLPSPSQIPQMFQREEGPSPLLHTSPPAAITMEEQRPLVVNTAGMCGGAELTEPTVEELNLLMAMPENFFEEMAEQERLNKVNNMLVEQDRTSNTPLPGSLTSANQFSENPMSPASSLQNPPADPPQVVVRPKKRRAGGEKRKKVVIDTVTQIPFAVMKKQIDNCLTETRSLSEVVSLASLMKLKSSPERLFSATCKLMVDPHTLSLWTQCALLTGHNEREQLKAQLKAQRREKRKRVHSEMSKDSDESTESSSAADVQSHGDDNTPATRSPGGEVQGPMQRIAEENDEMPEAQSQDFAERLLRLVSSHHQKSRRITFDTLLPPEANRLTAACTMYKLLELVEAKKLVVLQFQAFSPMWISPAA